LNHSLIQSEKEINLIEYVPKANNMFRIIADVINMFRLEGVCDNIKSPLAPLFEKGGGNAYTPALLIAAIGVLILLQAVISSRFDKGGQGDLIKRRIGTNF